MYHQAPQNWTHFQHRGTEGRDFISNLRYEFKRYFYLKPDSRIINADQFSSLGRVMKSMLRMKKMLLKARIRSRAPTEKHPQQH